MRYINITTIKLLLTIIDFVVILIVITIYSSFSLFLEYLCSFLFHTNLKFDGALVPEVLGVHERRIKEHRVVHGVHDARRLKVAFDLMGDDRELGWRPSLLVTGSY